MGKLMIPLILLVAMVSCGTLECLEVGDCKRANLDGCNTVHNPLPFKWNTSVTLTKDYYWHGADDIFFIYSNPDSTPIKPNCATATTLPGQYHAGDKISIEQTCYSFDVTVKKGARVSFWLFYSY
jgi:hypothetical protein